MPWIHPARFNEYAPVRAADLNDLSADHEVLLGDIARVSMPYASPIWDEDLGELYKNMALWHWKRYLWLRVTGLRIQWTFEVNGVTVVARTWPGGGDEYTWTETIDLSITNPNLIVGKIYDCRINYDGSGGEPSWIHLKAAYERESI